MKKRSHSVAIHHLMNGVLDTTCKEGDRTGLGLWSRPPYLLTETGIKFCFLCQFIIKMSNRSKILFPNQRRRRRKDTL